MPAEQTTFRVLIADAISEEGVQQLRDLPGPLSSPVVVLIGVGIERVQFWRHASNQFGMATNDPTQCSPVIGIVRGITLEIESRLRCIGHDTASCVQQ